ncbi:hypothetical protein PORY_000232 [Pneumocystis oryctolagi]|uniref:Uncharacterized protein n=1 Tax=Pneumocystis oryctolagi TaxID=42067 RepID=A0ACB7CJD8_9ASCO|nr:hypothetical protein PORY_000232 [Pneumocystis oryctolagi]
MENRKENIFYEKSTFTENASKTCLNSPSESSEKNIPWLCSSCCETFQYDELMYSTVEKQKTYYCKNCYIRLSYKSCNNFHLINVNNTDFQVCQNKNSQKVEPQVFSGDTDNNESVPSDLKTNQNGLLFYKDSSITNIENTNKTLLKNIDSAESLEKYAQEEIDSSTENNLSSINNLVSKINISQTCISTQNSIKNSQVWELLRKKKRNSLNIRKHIEGFTEIKRLHNSSSTPNIINISSTLSSSPNKIDNTENIGLESSFITQRETQTIISQENVPPTLTPTKNYKYQLFSTESTKNENNALSSIDYNSFSEKEVFSRHLKTSPNHNKQSFLCDCCKENLTDTTIQILEGKKYHKSCFKCNFCTLPFRENEYIFYKNNIYHKKCISEPKSSFLSRPVSPEKTLISETISNIGSLKNNSKGMFSVKKSSQPKFGGFDKCAGCGESITFLESYPGPNSTKWHKKCLKCNGGCGKNMDSGALNETEKDGKMKVYCRACWDATKKGKKRMIIPLVMSNTLRDFSTFENHSN